MRARDNPETDAPVVDVQDVPPQRAAVLDDPEKRREASADSQQKADGNGASREFEVNRDELGRFDLKRAGLPDMSIEAAPNYVSEHRAARPWLAMTDGASPEARRIIAAMDAAGGHAHIRHEGWVTEEANRRRVAYREDPAQLDPDRRSQGIDGIRPNDQRHRIGDFASRITDPDAFAAAFVRGVQHPKVREALDMPFGADRPDQVKIPIAELLGPEGHEHCTGWRLEPVGGSADTARNNRADWLKARAEGRPPDVPEPRAAPVRAFEGGEIGFAFTRNASEQRYEIVTMFVEPRDSPQSRAA